MPTHDNIMPSHLWLICGLPGAGKTTLAKRIVDMAREYNSVGLLVDRLSFDDHFTQQQDALEFDPVAWKLSQRRMAQRVKAQLQSAEQLDGDSDNNTVLLVDDNMQLQSMRKRFFQIALEGTLLVILWQYHVTLKWLLCVERYSAQCGFGILYVHTPIGICRERNEARGQSERVPDTVFQRMVDAFEPPDHKKCAFEANLVVLESDASLGDCIQTLLVNAERLKHEYSAKVQEITHKKQMRVSVALKEEIRTSQCHGKLCMY